MLFLVRLFLTLHIAISFSNVICKQSFFSLKNNDNYGSDYNYKNAAVIMAMVIVVINKFTHCMSIATKTITKSLKKFKKTIFVAFSR